MISALDSLLHGCLSLLLHFVTIDALFREAAVACKRYIHQMVQSCQNSSLGSNFILFGKYVSKCVVKTHVAIFFYSLPNIYLIYSITKTKGKVSLNYYLQFDV